MLRRPSLRVGRRTAAAPSGSFSPACAPRAVLDPRRWRLCRSSHVVRAHAIFVDHLASTIARFTEQASGIGGLSAPGEALISPIAGNPYTELVLYTDVRSSPDARSSPGEALLPDVETSVIEPGVLDALLHALASRGFRVLGPRVRDGAIVYDDIGSSAELPIGWTDRQDAGTYRLERREDQARFGYAVGPHSWKQFLLPPSVRLWRARRRGENDFEVEEEPVDDGPIAFFGVRSCELHAIAIQDRIFLEGRYVDRDYAARRQDAFVVAVNCFEPAGTCFCVSMGTGPKAEAGYDLALTEILDGEHRLLVEVGTERGAEVLRELPRREAVEADLRAAGAAVAGAAERMGRELDVRDLRDLLARNLEHERWDDVAQRCLTCGNCTMVCPTCFCTTVDDVTDLAGEETERVRLWDSCFSVDHAHIHGGSIRPSGRSQYRQWLTHKFGTWHDQFGTSGCVGCGRCIAWCPVGIDVTEELTAIRASEEATDGDH